MYFFTSFIEPIVLIVLKTRSDWFFLEVSIRIYISIRFYISIRKR